VARSRTPQNSPHPIRALKRPV